MEATAQKKVALRKQISARLAAQSATDVRAKSAAVWERLSIVREFATAVGLPCVSLLGSQLAPEDLIGALLWLTSNEASGFVTGVVLPIDGGFAAFSGV